MLLQSVFSINLFANIVCSFQSSSQKLKLFSTNFSKTSTTSLFSLLPPIFFKYSFRIDLLILLISFCLSVVQSSSISYISSFNLNISSLDSHNGNSPSTGFPTSCI